MAISFTNLGQSSAPDFTSTTNATSYASASWTPPSSGLLLVAVYNRVSSGTAAVPSVSGNGVTWTQVATVLSSNSRHRLSLFAAGATGSSAGATTFSFGTQSQTACSAAFCYASGVDLSGGVAAAFVQAPTASGGNATSVSVALAAAAAAENRPFAAFAHSTSEDTTPRTGWTELDDLLTGFKSLETQARVDAFETTASASWATASQALGIAVELKAAAVAPVHEGEATLVGVGVLPADGSLQASGEASLQGVGVAGAEGSRQLLAEASLQGVGLLEAEGSVTAVVHEGEATLVGVAVLPADGSLQAAGQASFIGVGVATAEGSGQLLGQAGLQGVGVLTAEGSGQLLGEATLVGVAVATAEGSVTAFGQASLVGVGVLTADGAASFGAQAVLEAVAALAVEGRLALLGEAAVFNSRRHTATAIALVESEVLGINANAFVDFVRHHPEVALRLLESFSHQLQRAQERMEDIAFLDVPARVAKRLIELALEFGEKTAQGYLITLRLTQSELAALVGASRESVNKALRLFAEKGLLRSERRGLLITDLAALQRRIY